MGRQTSQAQLEIGVSDEYLQHTASFPSIISNLPWQPSLLPQQRLTARRISCRPDSKQAVCCLTLPFGCFALSFRARVLVLFRNPGGYPVVPPNLSARSSLVPLLWFSIYAPPQPTVTLLLPQPVAICCTIIPPIVVYVRPCRTPSKNLTRLKRLHRPGGWILNPANITLERCVACSTPPEVATYVTHHPSSEGNPHQVHPGTSK